MQLRGVSKSVVAMARRQLFLCASLTAAALVGAACPRAQLAWQNAQPVINASSPGAADNRYGFEDGIVVRRADGSLLMIAAEMYDDPKWVRMRLGVWAAAPAVDPLAWRRVRSLRVSDANFNGSSLHSSSWGPFVLHDPASDTWALSYVGYRGAPSNGSGWLENFQGTIFFRPASVSGDAGLDTDFGDSSYAEEDAQLLAPSDWNINGPWPHPCQGLQGTDSMYPFRLDDGTWAALVGTSHQEANDKWGAGKWPVSLATAPSLAGPWTRYNPSGGDPADAPCLDINGGYTENPIVSRRPDNASAFHAVYDNLAGEGEGFGYVCSDDGFHWETGAVVRTPGGSRTPFGLVPMEAAEIARMTPAILEFGALNASQLAAPNSSLQWSFYTQNAQGYENFVAAITYLSW